MPLPEEHASHPAIRAWRDFFVHIHYCHRPAHRHWTRTIGRIRSSPSSVAGGTPGVVEEVDDHRRIVEFNIETTRKASFALDADIPVLRAQQSSRSPVPKKLISLGSLGHAGRHVAGRRTERVVALMPHDQLRRTSHVYAVLAAFMMRSRIGARWKSLGRSHSGARRNCHTGRSRNFLRDL